MTTAPIAPAGVGLAHLAPGFAAPALASQQVFRAVLEAMSRPGTVQRLPASALQDLPATAPSAALRAVLLTLLDAEATLHLGSGLGEPDDPGLSPWLRFHTGVRRGADATTADFVALPAAAARAALWRELRPGSDEVPQDGATLIVDVPHLGDDPAGPDVTVLSLRGPGVRDAQPLAVAGLDVAFWRGRIAQEADFPRGIDLILTCGDRVAALPRGTHVALPADPLPAGRKD